MKTKVRVTLSEIREPPLAVLRSLMCLYDGQRLARKSAEAKDPRLVLRYLDQLLKDEAFARLKVLEWQAEIQDRLDALEAMK